MSRRTSSFRHSPRRHGLTGRPRPDRWAAAAITAAAMITGSALAQEYGSSVVGTDFDFITDADPSTFRCLEFKGRMPREMPDKRQDDAPLIKPAWVFVGYFADGTSMDMALDADFGSREAARAEAMRYAPRLGKLPTSLRRGVRRLVVHRGAPETTAFSDRGLIIVYSANATRRIATHDLEETIFHESVHASWDARHAGSEAWLAAQRSDGAFVTHYARKNPKGEDLAESALFAYTLLHHPERIPAADAERIRRAIPARIAFVRTLLPPGTPVMKSVGPPYPCDGSGTTFSVGSPAEAAEELPSPAAPGADGPTNCRASISTPGGLSDILSNALMLGMGVDERRVSTFLDGAEDRYPTADALLDAAAAHFVLGRDAIEKQVQVFLHCNCDHD